MFDLTKNYNVSRNVAAQGMVLLKNENKALPLKPFDKVGIVGKGCLSMTKGGGGSSLVKCEYEKSLLDGIYEKANEGKIDFAEDTVKFAKADNYEVSALNEMAKKIDKALVVFKRNGAEGGDRLVGKKPDGTYPDKETSEYEEKTGYYYLSQREVDLFENLEKSNIKEVVLILNIAAVVDLSFIEKYSKIKAVLMVSQPGMEAGRAVADVLCGDVNPSGKLVDTVAYDYRDYPTCDCYDYDPYKTEYKEGIFVGYRYFETYAKDKVMYPFGFGLSYTEFDYSNYDFTEKDGIITVSADITNIGETAGKEVVQVYVSAPSGKLKKPTVELKAYSKTRELKPGETETVEISFKTADMASFDHLGETGFKGAWVLEKGDYEIFVAKSVRELFSCGVYFFEETVVAEQLTVRFDGTKYQLNNEMFTNEEFEPLDKMSLYDVAEGKMELTDFVNRLSVREVIDLALGQPLGFAEATSGIGNIKKYGVPNPQTADGPAGVRRAVNTTCFPCGTLVACTWDEDLLFEMGKAMGYEGFSTGVDILLGPALNIHRDPLAGRNFEYHSEDPLVSGKTSAAIVRGIQSEGLCATLKHFAVNNCEYYRCVNSSEVDERTLREIYLKGFEIAVKESNPAYIMTSYNLLNGEHTSACAQLLRGVLRDEWGYEGATMTDWRNGVSMTDEIIAGNNIKMPFGYPDEGDKTFEAYKKGEIELATIRENAYRVLYSVMKTRSFVQKDFGIIHKLDGDFIDIPVMEVNGLASSRITHETREDGVEYLYRLNREQRNQRSFVYYMLDVAKAGEYEVKAEISTNCPATQIWYYDADGNKLGTAYCDVATDETKWYTVFAKIKLSKGENMLKMVFANEPDTEYPYFNAGAEIPNAWPVLSTDDIKLAKLTLSYVGE